MATFPSINPTYGMRKTSSPRIRTTAFGDGYEFRALFGLPLTQDPKVYDLTFNVSETDADVIEGFLRSRVMIKQALHLLHQKKEAHKQGHIRSQALHLQSQSQIMV